MKKDLYSGAQLASALLFFLLLPLLGCFLLSLSPSSLPKGKGEEEVLSPYLVKALRETLERLWQRALRVRRRRLKQTRVIRVENSRKRSKEEKTLRVSRATYKDATNVNFLRMYQISSENVQN